MKRTEAKSSHVSARIDDITLAEFAAAGGDISTATRYGMVNTRPGVSVPLQERGPRDATYGHWRIFIDAEGRECLRIRPRADLPGKDYRVVKIGPLKVYVAGLDDPDDKQELTRDYYDRLRAQIT